MTQRSALTNTQAVSGVRNHGRQHGKPAPLPAQPAPPPAQAEPRAARPVNPPNPLLLKGGTVFRSYLTPF